jgi:Ras-related protein Rab-11A
MSKIPNYKIVIIGESNSINLFLTPIIGMVGKTSLSKRFITGKFVKIDIKDRTVNTNCYQKRIQINNSIINLNVWDTAGEEKYHAMAPIFYRGAEGAVVIFDVTKKETFNRATKWFQELNDFAEGNPKIILVGNKIDLPNRAVSNQEAISLAKQYNCNFLEVSALEGTNVNEVFNLLTSDIYNSKKKISHEMSNGSNELDYSNKKNRGKKLNIEENDDNNNLPSENRKGACC